MFAQFVRRGITPLFLNKKKKSMVEKFGQVFIFKKFCFNILILYIFTAIPFLFSFVHCVYQNQQSLAARSPTPAGQSPVRTPGSGSTKVPALKKTPDPTKMPIMRLVQSRATPARLILEFFFITMAFFI